MTKHVARGMALTLLLTSPALAQPRVEKNVIFGMYSGAALLMDVYHPAQSNGLALIVIPGSGWYMPQRYDAPALKDDPFASEYGRRFAEAGYTAFVINHRASPRFRYPAAIEDAQRAVRFIRHNASGMALMDDALVPGALHPVVISRHSLEPWTAPGIPQTPIQ